MIATIGDRLASLASKDREMHVGLMDQLESLLRSLDEASPTRRLDGRSKELLAASIRMMPYEERGWIPLKEATILFSSEDGEYAFREMDRGTQNLASFVAEETRGCRFAFIEGRLFFMRTTSQSSEMQASFDKRAFQKGRPSWSEAVRRMIGLKDRRIGGHFSNEQR